jgi:acetate kinase
MQENIKCNERGLELEGIMNKILKVPVEVSARHIHLAKKDFEKLFGKQNPISPIKKLSQEGEFAAEEKVSLINKDKRIDNVRILGPFRKNSQVEIALTDAYHLRLNPLPKIKVSGDLANTTKILVHGPKDSAKIPCIIAQRHLHCSEDEAKKLKIKNNQIIKIKISGKRGLIFDNIIVRTNPKFRASVHLDTDEGNSAGISGKTFGELVR